VVYRLSKLTKTLKKKKLASGSEFLNYTFSYQNNQYTITCSLSILEAMRIINPRFLIFSVKVVKICCYFKFLNKLKIIAKKKWSNQQTLI